MKIYWVATAPGTKYISEWTGQNLFPHGASMVWNVTVLWILTWFQWQGISFLMLLLSHEVLSQRNADFKGSFVCGRTTVYLLRRPYFCKYTEFCALVIWLYFLGWDPKFHSPAKAGCFSGRFVVTSLST